MKDICQSVMTSLLFSPAAPALLAVGRKTILFFAFGQGLKNGLGRVGRRRRRRKNNGGHSPPHLLSGEGEGRGEQARKMMGGGGPTGRILAECTYDAAKKTLFLAMRRLDSSFVHSQSTTYSIAQSRKRKTRGAREFSPLPPPYYIFRAKAGPSLPPLPFSSPLPPPPSISSPLADKKVPLGDCILLCPLLPLLYPCVPFFVGCLGKGSDNSQRSETPSSSSHYVRTRGAPQENNNRARSVRRASVQYIQGRPEEGPLRHPHPPHPRRPSANASVFGRRRQMGPENRMGVVPRRWRREVEKEAFLLQEEKGEKDA